VKWRGHKKFYPNDVVWWARYVKGQIRKFYIGEGTNRRQDRTRLVNFYYDAIYAAVQNTNHTDSTYITLKALKAKMISLHHEPLKCLFLDTDDQDKQEDELPSSYHVPKQRGGGTQD
jgi:hypothetical protein